MPIRDLDDGFSVSEWIVPADFSRIRALGFDRVINFRPDGEAQGQQPSAEAERAATSAGLAYFHVPTTKFDVFTTETLEQTAKALGAGGRTLGYCASGLRAGMVWAAVAVASRSVDDALATLKASGIAAPFIRDDLEGIADRSRWTPVAATDDRSAAIHQRRPSASRAA